MAIVRRKYLGKYKNKYMLPEDDDFLCFVDNLFWFHKKHLKLRKLLKQHEELLIKSPEEFFGWIKNFKLAEKQIDVNVSIKAFFALVMIELYKCIEGDNVFRWTLDESISMDWFYYYRLRYKKKELVDTITKQIKHFRDACVHKEDDKISTWPEFVEHNIEWWKMFLPFATNWEREDWYFMIWRWKLPFNRLEQIIEYTFNYYYPMPEKIRKRIRQRDKEYKSR